MTVAPAAVTPSGGDAGSRAGHLFRDAQRNAARPATPSAGNGGGGTDHLKSGAQPHSVRPANPPRVGVAALVAASQIVTRSLLDTFRANGRPVGDLTANEAEAWCKSHERDGRFVRLLIDGLPPVGRIRDHRTAEDAAKLYRIAEEAANA